MSGVKLLADKSSGCGSCRSVSWSAGRRPSRTRSLAVSVTATSSPSGPVHVAIPVLPPCGPAGRKDSDFRPAALHIVSACSAPAGADCRNGTGGCAHHPYGYPFRDEVGFLRQPAVTVIPVKIVRVTGDTVIRPHAEGAVRVQLRSGRRLPAGLWHTGCGYQGSLRWCERRSACRWCCSCNSGSGAGC